MHNWSVISRRELLNRSASVPLLLQNLTAQTTGQSGLQLILALTNNPDAVPPPLGLDPEARIALEFDTVSGSTFCLLSLFVQHNKKPFLLPVAGWTTDINLLRHAREILHLPVFQGEVNRGDGSWEVLVNSRRVFKAWTGPSTSSIDHEIPDQSLLTYRTVLSPDWTIGPLQDSAVELWKLNRPSTSSWQGLAIEKIEIQGDLDGWLSRLGATELLAANQSDSARQALIANPEFVQLVDTTAFEPFALHNYPKSALEFIPRNPMRLQEDELEQYRNHSNINIQGILLVSTDLVAPAAQIAPLLPPPCRPLQRPLIRVLAIRGLYSSSLDEAWLLVQCVLQGRIAWYALSHLRADITGSEFGREVFGYPTKDGNVNAQLGTSQFGADISRNGQLLFRSDGVIRGFSTGISLGNMEVVLLRLSTASQSMQPTGELVLQNWYSQGLRKPVAPGSVLATFPSPTNNTAGFVPESWQHVGLTYVDSATVFDNATMQRQPGTVVASVEGPGTYYLDRCDGLLPWKFAPLAATGNQSD